MADVGSAIDGGTMLTAVTRGFAALAGAVIMAAVLVQVSAGSAAAVDCDPGSVWTYVGGGQYACVKPGGGTGTGPGPGGGGTGPVCDTSGAPPYASIMEGHIKGPITCADGGFCVLTDIIVPLKGPDGDPPNEESQARLRWCTAGGIFSPWEVVARFWTDEADEPSLLEQAQTAVGQIDVGAPQLSISPNGRTLVNLDTWFWVTSGVQEATGSSAFGLVAFATFRSLDVDPGDGTGAMSCPWVTSAAAAESDCSHTYRRSSRGGTYAATASIVYDLRFEMDGNPIVIPGAPATLDAPGATTPIRVEEVQSVVTSVN